MAGLELDAEGAGRLQGTGVQVAGAAQPSEGSPGSAAGRQVAGEGPADASGAVSLVLRLAYDGAAYSGYAKQKDPRIHTVQGELERALGTLLGQDVATVCAGRTDAGVHALGQVASCQLPRAELAGRNLGKLRISLNALTPDDISVKDVGVADAAFSARFSAVRREYRYRIATGGEPPLFLRAYAWHCRGSLDADAMREGAAQLVGEHDFASFCKAASAQGKNTVRCIEELSIEPDVQLGEEHLVVRVVGNAFLHSMVRTIVGTLVEAGCGRRPPEWVGQALRACQRSAAGQTAPACGLTFWGVQYPPGAVRWGAGEQLPLVGPSGT